ncbi:MAG TPA: type I phosphomannose isomerase catalytic subunit [Steroidobacteraceae bacterium]|nr:type I phosphomannose isomerase catalytic subunit [Steroidobacteraceae bacterium]
MSPVPLYPLRFDPFFQYRPWGGRRLTDLLSLALPGEDLVGEAWILSDRDEHSSVVANGPLKGITLGQLVNDWPNRMLGNCHGVINRFPLLLKFLDVRTALSVQVHPSDRQTKYLPDGESGKTEAWIVLGAGQESLIYAGLTPQTTPDLLREALAEGAVTHHLASFVPSSGDAVFIPAGTVHSLRDLVIFEVQQNSNVTFRLYDWNQIDPKTLQHRALQVAQAMACIDFTRGAITPVVPLVEQLEPVLRERLFDCEHFRLWRLCAKSPFTVGSAAAPHVLVCVAGEGNVTQNGADVPFSTGDVLLLPAEVGACLCRPSANLELLEISLPRRSPPPISSP